MAGRLVCAGLLLVAPAVWAVEAEPAPVEIRVKVPGDGTATLRLAFRKGVQIKGTRLPKRLLKGPASKEWMPFENLSPEGKRWALEVLFPDDEWRRGEVRHHVRWPELESVWLMASLFTGHGQNYDRLQEDNPRNAEKPRRGDVWHISKDLLSVDLGGNLRGVVNRHQPEDDLDDEARMAAYRKLLSYEDDPDGKVAVYRMRRGEALYSSVVMRYTDRVEPKDVNDLALVLAKRSGISDVRAIPSGAVIRIPVRYLADPFLPEGSQALEEEREVREEVRRTTRIDAGPRLRGVRIVLDAGHGGVDPGARANGVWESDYVYDIAMRTRRLLEQDTDAQVSSTIRYPAVGFRVRDEIEFPARAAEILTTPPIANDGENPSAVNVHLRWLLANDLFNLHAKRGEVQKTLFISFHADALHPTARGTMVYVPGAAAVPASFSLGSSRTLRVAEARSARVRFSPKERLQGEARSRLFAETLMKTLKTAKLPIHENRPIRNIIHRSGRSFVPAVIRYSNASAKVLVEVANLTNEEDAENLKNPEFRERYAEALVKGIRAYFGK